MHARGGAPAAAAGPAPIPRPLGLTTRSAASRPESQVRFSNIVRFPNFLGISVMEIYPTIYIYVATTEVKIGKLSLISLRMDLRRKLARDGMLRPAGVLLDSTLRLPCAPAHRPPVCRPAKTLLEDRSPRLRGGLSVSSVWGRIFIPWRKR
jgi:hypothetical protein